MILHYNKKLSKNKEKLQYNYKVMQHYIGRGKRIEVPIKAKFRERKSPTILDKSSGRGSVGGNAKDHPKGRSFCLVTVDNNDAVS